MTTGRCVPWVIGALSLAGCPWFGPGGDRLPNEATYCTDVPDEVPDGAHIDIELGRVAQGQFTPYVDGQALRLLHGGQGGHMVPLWVRLSDEESGCARIELELRLVQDGDGGADNESSHSEQTERTVKAGTTDALLVQVDDLTGWTNGAGRTLSLRATVTTHAGKGQRSVSLHLVE